MPHKYVAVLHKGEIFEAMCTECGRQRSISFGNEPVIQEPWGFQCKECNNPTAVPIDIAAVDLYYKSVGLEKENEMLMKALKFLGYDSVEEVVVSLKEEQD